MRSSSPVAAWGAQDGRKTQSTVTKNGPELGALAFVAIGKASLHDGPEDYGDVEALRSGSGLVENDAHPGAALCVLRLSPDCARGVPTRPPPARG